MSSTTIQPCFNYLLCRLHLGNASAAGLHIPDTVALAPHGEVLSVGPDAKTFAVGEKILFNPNAVIRDIDPQDPSLFLISEPSIFAKYV